jgi:hypothetical protein
MWARMCLLETIPGAFDSYLPPPGINVAWYWDFEGKENDNQVIGFFTAQEIAMEDSGLHNDGDIKKEVEKNRCFVCLRTVDPSEWDSIIPGFSYHGQELTVPKIHPKLREEWKPKEKFRTIKFKDKDGKNKEEQELMEFEAELEGDILTEINTMRFEQGLDVFQPAPEKVRIKKLEGFERGNKTKKQKERTMVTIDYVKIIDEIKAEKN